jgi:hypothetical protein
MAAELLNAVNAVNAEQPPLSPREPSPDLNPLPKTVLPEPLLKKWAEQAQVMAWVCYRVSERDHARYLTAAFLALVFNIAATGVNFGLAFSGEALFAVKVGVGVVQMVVTLLIVALMFFRWQENAKHMHTMGQEFSHLGTLLQVMLAGGDEPEGCDPRRLLTQFQALENQMHSIPDSVQAKLSARFGGTRSIPTVAGGIPTIVMRR